MKYKIDNNLDFEAVKKQLQESYMIEFKIDNNLDLEIARKYIKESYNIENGNVLRNAIVKANILKQEDYIKILSESKRTAIFDHLAIETIFKKLGTNDNSKNSIYLDNKILIDFTKDTLTHSPFNNESYGEMVRENILTLILKKFKEFDYLNIEDLKEVINNYGSKEHIEQMNKYLFTKVNEFDVEEMILYLNEFNTVSISEQEFNALLKLKNMDVLESISKNKTLSDEQYIEIFNVALDIRKDSTYNINVIDDVYENLLKKDIKQINNFLAFKLLHEDFDHKKLDEKIKYIIECKDNRQIEDSSLYWSLSNKLTDSQAKNLNEYNEIIKSYIENVEFKNIEDKTRSFS